MPAPSSLSIAAVVDQVGGAELPDPVVLAPGLRDALGGVADPRKRRGVRHGLVIVLTAAVCAVAAGARSFVAVAEWVADVPDDIAALLGTDRRCPSESTIRRVLGTVDPDRFDAVIGAFVQRLCAGRATAGRRCVLAVDGKTVRVRHEVACSEWITAEEVPGGDVIPRLVLGGRSPPWRASRVTAGCGAQGSSRRALVPSGGHGRGEGRAGERE